MDKKNIVIEKVVLLTLLFIYLIFNIRYVLLVAVLLHAIIDSSKFIKSKNIYKHLVSGLLFVMLGISIILGGQEFILKPFTIVVLLVTIIYKYIIFKIFKKGSSEN